VKNDPKENKAIGDLWLFLRLRKVTPTLKLAPRYSLFNVASEATPS